MTTLYSKKSRLAIPVKNSYDLCENHDQIVILVHLINYIFMIQIIFFVIFVLYAKKSLGLATDDEGKDSRETFKMALGNQNSDYFGEIEEGKKEEEAVRQFFQNAFERLGLPYHVVVGRRGDGTIRITPEDRVPPPPPLRIEEPQKKE